MSVVLLQAEGYIHTRKRLHGKHSALHSSKRTAHDIVLACCGNGFHMAHGGIERVAHYESACEFVAAISQSARTFNAGPRLVETLLRTVPSRRKTV